jgi:hypothetical protein
VDYLVIGPTDLLEPIEPLLEHRESLGLKVMAIPIDEIYDHFGFGLPDPESIRSFLRYAHLNWNTGPKFVVLIGDSTYDPRGYLSGKEENWVPTFMVNTSYGGETASDILLSYVDEDIYPDFAVGRVPAREPNQVQIFVEKLIAYENQSEDQAWQHRVLAVADSQDPIFQAGAESFLGRFSNEYVTNLMSMTEKSNNPVDQVKSGIEDGNLIVTYFGHGSIDTWGKDQLFTVEEAALLQNEDRLPLVMTMTCLNGLFTHPEVESLAETLLWNSHGGAVAVLAPTSLTLTTDQTLLSRAFIDAMSENSEFSIGEILLSAQQTIPDENQGAVEVMQTFLLFGDPAMRLAYP